MSTAIQRASKLYDLAQEYLDHGRSPNKPLEPWEQELRLWDAANPSSEPSPGAISRLMDWNRQRTK
jgi:hypothetical protein